MLTTKEAIVNNEIILIDETTLSSQVIGKCSTDQLWHALEIIRKAEYTEEELKRKENFIYWSLYNRNNSKSVWPAKKHKELGRKVFEYGKDWHRVAAHFNTTAEKVRFEYFRGSVAKGLYMANKILEDIDPKLPEEDQNLTAEKLGRKVAQALTNDVPQVYINDFFKGFVMELRNQKKTNNIAVPIKRYFNLFDRKEVSDMRTEMMNQFHKLTGIETPFIEKDSIIRFENRLKQSK